MGGMETRQRLGKFGRHYHCHHEDDDGGNTTVNNSIMVVVIYTYQQ